MISNTLCQGIPEVCSYPTTCAAHTWTCSKCNLLEASDIAVLLSQYSPESKLVALLIALLDADEGSACPHTLRMQSP